MNTKCALCDLTIGSPTAIQDNLAFCCHGCKAVYTILSSKNSLENPRENPIFLQALQSGIISNPQLLEELSFTKTVSSTHQDTQRWHFEIGEMWCPTCAELTRWILLRERGVLNCVVDYATDLASVEFHPMETSKDKLTALIKQIGYTVSPLDETNSRPVSKSLYLRLAIASFCSLNVMMLAYPLYATFFDGEEQGAGNLFAWISLYASIPVLTYCAWPIFSKCWNSLKVGMLGMEALVTTGILAATGLSIYELIQGSNHVYFDSMTVIVAFVLLGKTLEARAKFSAKEAFIQLTRALPRKGRKKIDDSKYEFVPVKEIALGDILVAFSGEKIVLDGIVHEGVGVCDESVMTGEPMPITKVVGNLVVAGTVLQQGELHYIVNAPPEKSLLSRIVEMTHAQLGKKQGYIRPADHIVKWFIPLVFAIAFITGLVCYFYGIDDGPGVVNTSILRMTAVLLISCPCAIGIAAPIAEGYLISALAQEGVIIRNRGVLSLLGTEDTFIFDKTGTVTHGKFKVLEGIKGLSSEQQAVLKTLTSHSNHLASRAIKEAIPCEPATKMDVVEIVSKGMLGTNAGEQYLLGSKAFMLEHNVVITTKEVSQADPITACYFACNGKLLATIQLGDTIREEIHETLLNLADTQTVLLSGDQESTVREIAMSCGFKSYAWERSPEQKMEYIQKAIDNGRITAMVGDGINDAPALTAAHVGISVVTASDLSIQVSDILLTTPRLTIIPKMRRLAKFAQSIVKQNLFWAFFYNTIGIVVAASGMLSPIYAASAMVISSLMVIGNAQRIR